MSGFEHLPKEEQMKRLQRLAAAALLHYKLPDDVEPHLVNLSENATYRIECPSSGKTWALRVHRDGYHSRNAIASELAWLNALREDGVVVTPTPVPGKDGELIQLVSHEAVPNTRHVVLSDWEKGYEPDEEQHDLRQSFEALGEIAARMHNHVRQWQRPAGFERPTWDFDTALGDKPHWGRWRHGMGLTPEIEGVFERSVELIARRLARFGKSEERFNLIHCDMRLANLLIDGDTTKVIDFDDSGFSWLMYDCATTVSFFEHKPEVPELLESWVRGYRRVRDLPKEDEAEIPTFVMLRRLLLVAWIGSHSETDLAQSMGVEYTQGTVALCESYLSKFS